MVHGRSYRENLDFQNGLDVSKVINGVKAIQSQLKDMIKHKRVSAKDKLKSGWW